MANEHTSRALINQKSLRDLAELLVRDGDIHEGLFDISVEIQVAIGTLGPTPDESYPGALVGVKSIGLLATEKANPHTVDAALVNPRTRIASPTAPKRRSASPLALTAKKSPVKK